MPRVAFTPHLKTFFPTLEECEVPGATVRAVLDELERRHPGLASYVVDEAGRLRRHVNIFVGDEPIYDRARLSDAVPEGGRVFIAQALSGG
jgi:molybdopterin synthase sulfur carrier subunit